MSVQLVAAPVLVALVTAVATLLARFSDRLTRATSLAGGLAYFAATAALFHRVVLAPETPTRLVYQVSNWAPPYGIALVADALSAFMLALAGPVVLAAAVYSVAYIDEVGQRLTYHPLFHFMIAGVSGAFLTGDVFNLFVWFEVMLMSSYVLVLFYSGPEHTRAALTYVVLNLLASAVMLVAIGGLYATVGTLNMADIARRVAEPAAYDVALAPTLGLAALLLAVFALKAGIVPFHFWVPAAYRAAPAPVTALLAGVVKKVGIYAVIRLFFTVFAAGAYAETSAFAYVGPMLFVGAVASMVYGGVGAVGRDDVDGLLAYSSIGQVGFIVLPLAVAMGAPTVATPLAGAESTLAVLGVAAALVYSFNHALAKGLLFLASGTIHSAVGTTDFSRLGGLAARTPLVAAGFLLGGLSLVGVPPLLGFFGKLLVFRTAAEAWAAGAPGAVVAAAAMLVGAVLTIAYVTRAWNAVFWGERPDTVEATLPERWGRRLADAGTDADAEAGVGATGTDTGTGTDSDGDGPEPATDGGPAVVTDRALAVQVTVVVTLAVAVVGFGVGAEFVVDAAVEAAEAATDTAGYVEAVDPAEPGGEYTPDGHGESGDGGGH